MSKRTFIVFGIFVLVLAVAIPFFVFRKRGDAETGAQDVPASLKSGQSLFETNCGTCHTLYAAGTDGNYGPNLDELLAPSGPPTGPTAASTIKATMVERESGAREGVSVIRGRGPDRSTNAARQCARPPLSPRDRSAYGR